MGSLLGCGKLLPGIVIPIDNVCSKRDATYALEAT
jgi:hypothetical protein